MVPNTDAIRYRTNLQGEIDSASLYRALAKVEADPHTSNIFRKLAAVEDAHAEFWQKNLKRIGSQVPAQRPGWRSRALAWLARRFGPDFVLSTINVLEHADSAIYDQQLDALAGKSDGLPGRTIASLEGRHRAVGGNALRAAVLGANDGLVSNLSLVMGVTGAATAQHIVLLTGLAGLFAALAPWQWVNGFRSIARANYTCIRWQARAKSSGRCQTKSLKSLS